MANKTIYLTEEGLEDLKKELEELKTVKRAEVIQALKEARALGDLSENAEYDAARNEQAIVEGRIKELEVMITSIFNVFEKNNIKSFRELKKLKWNQIVGMINEVNDIDEETKKLYSETIKDLIWLNNKK